MLYFFFFFEVSKNSTNSFSLFCAMQTAHNNSTSGRCSNKSNSMGCNNECLISLKMYWLTKDKKASSFSNVFHIYSSLFPFHFFYTILAILALKGFPQYIILCLSLSIILVLIYVLAVLLVKEIRVW